MFITTKEKIMHTEHRWESADGFIVKRNDSYQVISDECARNISIADFRTLMQYPD